MGIFEAFKSVLAGQSSYAQNQRMMSQMQILAENNLRPANQMRGSDVFIRQQAKNRLAAIDELNELTEEMISDLSYVESFGIPEATVLTVVVFYSQLKQKHSHKKALEIIDTLRIPPLLISVKEGMSLEDYLKLRIHQELHDKIRPPLTHPQWIYDGEFFERTISEANAFWEANKGQD